MDAFSRILEVRRELQLLLVYWGSTYEASIA